MYKDGKPLQRVVFIDFDPTPFNDDYELMATMIDTLADHYPGDSLFARIDDLVADMEDDIKQGEEFDRLCNLAYAYIDDLKESFKPIPREMMPSDECYIQSLEYGPGYVRMTLEDFDE